MEMTGAQILVEGMLHEGVEKLFGYAGATICPLADVLRDTPQLDYTLVRNEQNAAHMASGYARISGKTGVCIVTSGPGATNLLTGIATAYMDSIPLVAFTGQVPSHLLGRDIFQEVDITGAASAFSKHSYLVKDAAELPRIISESFHIASTGRPGPVLIDVPIDVQEQVVFDPVFPEEVNIRGYHPSVRGNDKQITHVVNAIATAQRPVICAGGGVFLSNALLELETFAARTRIPVVTTMMGLSLLPTDHPLNMGMIGTHGNACANKALAKSDLLIMIGTRAADRAIFSPQEIQRRMPSIHIDVDPAEIGKNIQTEIPLVGNVRVILQQLLERDLTTHCAPWLAQLRERRAQELDREYPVREGSVSPGRLLRLLGQRLRPNAAICVDVGQNQLWACKHLWLGGGRFLTSGGLGTMGYALPAAVGVKVADSSRQAVVICGDGSFQMSMNELAAVRTRNLDLKILLLDNGVLGLVRQIQNTPPYHGSFGVSLEGSPDYAAIAAAYGIPSIRADREAQVEDALDRFLNQPGSCLLVVRVDPDVTTND